MLPAHAVRSDLVPLPFVREQRARGVCALSKLWQ
jgi:hypothetical protein